MFNIIPYFGPFIGVVPSALLILLEDPLYCLYFVIMVMVIQQLDGSVISPKIIGGSTGLSSFWVIFAILVGQGIFGFVGLIIGIPLFAVVYSVLKGRVVKSLKKRELPYDTNAYRQIAYIDSETREITTVHEIHQEERLLKQSFAEKKAEERRQKHEHNRIYRFFSTLIGKKK